MLGSLRYGTAVGLILLNSLVLATQATEEGIFTNHLLVQLHEGAHDEAHQLATEHGFQSSRKLPFGEGLFHFYPQDTPQRRSKRSLRHRQRLEKDRRVSKTHTRARTHTHTCTHTHTHRHPGSHGNRPSSNATPKK
ncbi:unnamed protein product [Oncorhynchus mykiss]|uniref:Peptidase S8 pro-domain domain-containing protein n=1 Tax=Oncorhynchus mykiss TaxID=8022 RepID=A0A060YBP3_ONCMY|nr:unnamed protein product [Oncorhynchus mykiss]